MSKRTLFLVATIVLAGICLGFSASHAATIEKTLDFPTPTITYQRQGSAIAVQDLPAFGNPGEPLLPVYSVEILLPQGEDVNAVSARVVSEKEIIVDSPLVLAREELPTDSVARGPLAAPQASFDQDQPFPSARAVHVYTGTYRGYNIAFLNVYPVTYLASKNSIAYAPRLEIKIETGPSAVMLSRSIATLRQGRPKDIAAVGRMVDDVKASSSYTSRGLLGAAVSSLVDPDETHPYVIITISTLALQFEVLKQHKDRRGLNAEIVLVSDIAANYSGADLQTKIREFIKDAYLNWETEYVLLAGDDDVIPHRGFYAVGPSAVDNDIASDLYYAGLDGTWNDDGDANWGEPEEADLMPEVSVGRAAVGDSAEAANFVNKVIRYETAPVVSQIKSAQMVGEGLGSGTWGGDYKDEVKFGASTNGYTTAGFPPAFGVGTLYDRDLYPDTWDKSDLIPLLNSGRHLVNHLGHADVIYCMRMYNSDVDTALTNDGVTATYFILYSQGCYSGSFDNRSPSGYLEDCIGEHLTFAPNGAVAFIGNTRYGWYMPYSTNGTSQHYDRQFFDALFGEGHTAIGKAFDDSRTDNIPFINVGAMRWVYYDLVLLGDPAMDIWTDSPETLVVSHPDIIFAGDNQVEVSVASGAAPVAGARVSLFTGATYTCGYTDTGGTVYLNPMAAAPESLLISVTAHNAYAYLDTIPVEVAGRPVVVIEQFPVDDDTSGASFGNSNGRIDAGETIESRVALANVGQDSALDVSAVLRTSDPYVTVLDSSGTFGDIAPESTVVPGWSYTYQISPAVPDSHLVEFELAISCSDTSLVRRQWVSVSAPSLEITGISASDTLYGSGDGCIGPGETFELSLAFTNRGSGDGYGLGAMISAADPYVAISMDSAFVDSLLSGEEVTARPSYLLSVSPDCPEFHRIDLTLNLALANGWAATDTVSAFVGGSLADDMESGGPGWTHRGFADIRTDQWHLDGYRNHTAGGNYAWKFGGSGGATYADFGHGALETPELCLGPNATLTFWHWIHAELGLGKYAWDGGIVEISVDGGKTWSQIAPVGGYYYKIYPNFFSPFPGETPCFAWTGDWTRVEFDLSAYEGRAKIRFRFGSDQYYNNEGWYLDDVAVTDDYSSVAIPNPDLKVVPTRFALQSVSPNPASSRFSVVFDVPHRADVSVAVFDVAGRRITQVANSVFAPGRYSRPFDCSTTLAPGVYFISLRTEGFSETRKLIIVK
ncbi:MAG: C25 family cysteine peptidase [Candidatus Eisenbacteria bacterium]